MLFGDSPDLLLCGSPLYTRVIFPKKHDPQKERMEIEPLRNAGMPRTETLANEQTPAAGPITFWPPGAHAPRITKPGGRTTAEQPRGVRILGQIASSTGGHRGGPGER